MDGGREGRAEEGRERGREERVGSFWLSSKVQSTQAGKGQQQNIRPH